MVGITQFRHLLLLAPFKVRSDSISVKYIANLKDLRSPLPRYYNILSDFCFSAEHRPGSTNTPDDSVSRRDDLPSMDRYEEDFHSSRSYVDQLEQLQDKSLEFADNFPTLWNPQKNHSTHPTSSQPQEIVTADIVKKQSSISACLDQHPKLAYLNKIQSQFRGAEGKAKLTDYLTEYVHRPPRARVSEGSSQNPPSQASPRSSGLSRPLQGF